uniref:Uncharacterized protein n=2 Tax=Pinguiococcus pyrenoidosus TaxID=172671 RepID=A0A7R9UB03_9STRA
MDSGSVPTLILIALEEVGNAVEENPSQILDGTFVTESTIRNRIAMDVIQAVVREVSIEADAKEAILETIDTIFLAKEVDVLHAVKERRWSVLLAAALRQLWEDARCCCPKRRAESKKRSVEAEADSGLLLNFAKSCREGLSKVLYQPRRGNSFESASQGCAMYMAWAAARATTFFVPKTLRAIPRGGA